MHESSNHKSRDAAQMLERAIAIHQQGNIAAAENLYLQILRTQPDHFDALHCLGIIRLQQGNIEAAIELISAALRQSPDSAEAHNHLGAALKDGGRLDEAMVH